MQLAAPVVDSARDTLTLSKSHVQENRRLLSETRHRIAASRRRLNPALALTGGSDDGAREPETSHIQIRRASAAILGTLEETHSDHIVLNDQSRILLTPTVRCSYPVGTRLHIVYAESDGQKIALSIERSHW